MRPQRTIRAPRRYEDELEISPSSTTSSTRVVTRRGSPVAMSTSDRPFAPYDPAMVRQRPAAFPSRDVTANWGPLAGGTMQSTGVDPDSTDMNDPQTRPSSSKSPGSQTRTTPQTNLLLSTNHSLRALLSTSPARSDSATKLPRRAKSKVDTVRRCRPPPDPRFVKILADLPDLEAKEWSLEDGNEWRLEDVWRTFGRHSSSFLNQAVNAPRHGVRELVAELLEGRGPNYLRDKPSLLLVVPSPCPLGSHLGEEAALASQEHDRTKCRSQFTNEQQLSTKLSVKKEEGQHRNLKTSYPVDAQNGPFYSARFVNEGFLLDAADSEDEQSPQPRVPFSGRTLARFDHLSAQLAVDIYCQIYFEAQALGGEGQIICREILDLTDESEQQMHSVLAQRILDRLPDFTSPSLLVPPAIPDRPVRPATSPLVSSFAAPTEMSRLGRNRKDVDWDYVSAQDLDAATTFLTAHSLPHSFLRDWMPDQEQTRTPSALASSPPHPPPRRKRRSATSRRRPPHSDSEFEDEDEIDNTSATTSRRASVGHESVERDDVKRQNVGSDGFGRQRNGTAGHAPAQLARHRALVQQSSSSPNARLQHMPPRPSFARPGASVARAPRGGRESSMAMDGGEGGWRAQPDKIAYKSVGGSSSGTGAKVVPSERKGAEEGVKRGRGRPRGSGR